MIIYLETNRGLTNCKTDNSEFTLQSIQKIIKANSINKAKAVISNLLIIEKGKKNV